MSAHLFTFIFEVFKQMVKFHKKMLVVVLYSHTVKKKFQVAAEDL